MQTQIKAFTQKRPPTNLISDVSFDLPDAEKRTGFLCIFNKTYAGLPRNTLMKVALGALMDTRGITVLKPGKASSLDEKTARKIKTKLLNQWENARSESKLSFYTKLKKVNSGDTSYFQLHLPLLLLPSPAAIGTALSVLGFVGEAPTEAFDTFSNVASGPNMIPAALAIQHAAGIDVKAAAALGQCLMGVEIDKGATTVVSLVFKVPMKTCEYLASTKWQDIRPVDLYPLFTMWVAAEYLSRFYGKTSFPMSRISETLPPHDPTDARIDSNNLSVGPTGNLLWIPSPCDDATKYEQRFAASGVRDDGSFQLLHADSQGNLQKPLPRNIPILTDWVNFKFTYSNTLGRAETIPLEHYRKCTPSMAMNLLNNHLDADVVTALKHWAAPCGIPATTTMANVAYTGDENAALNRYFRDNSDSLELELNVKFAFAAAKDSGYTPRLRDLTPDTSEVLFKPLGDFVRRLYAACLSNIEALYSQYSVDSVIKQMGFLGLIATYGARIQDTLVASNTYRRQYTEQNIDPNWKPPAMPMVSKKMNTPEGGFLPHQANIRNLMRNSPDNAVFAVPAGGGKSPLSITDILQEIQQGGTGPFMLMCPSFLVANYVSEIVEFTDGKLNCIPVTSYNINTTGFARYEEILEAAPVNTVFVVDFDVTKFQPKTTVYGTSIVQIFPVVEMLRRFKPTLVILDEVHLLKNAGTARFKAVMGLVADIPKKRIASGTLNPDSPSDLPGEMSFLDPTIFGTRDQFNATYGEIVSGTRVMKWRSAGPNSLKDVITKASDNVVWCQAKRREWACALPERHDMFIPVALTRNQHLVYDALFEEMVQSIREKAKTHKGTAKLLEKLEGKKASKDDEKAFKDMGDEDEDEGDEEILDDSTDAGPSLQPYLADLERFITNPIWHPYARNGFITETGTHIAPLTGDDTKSPKILKLIELMHTKYKVLDSNAPKTLIFVNYNESVDAIFDAMPPELQECGIKYSCSTKVEHVNQFKTDPKKRWMVGIRHSLETGLNFQVANVLVRMECVWNPGEQEQGDSRIARPYFGPGGDKRKGFGLFFDTITCDASIDVTKAARLRAKIVAVAKAENATDPNYQDIQDIPIIPMTLEAIKTQNSFDTNLRQYQEAMRHLNQVIQNDYDEYAAKQMAEGGLKFVQVAQAPVPEGCAILSRVPYAPGTELYNATEMGYMRVDNFLGMDKADDEDDDDAPDEGGVHSRIVDTQLASIMGFRAHTEQGDGFIISGAGLNYLKWVRVACDDGTTIRVKSTACFIATRTETNGIDLRNKIAQATGLPVSREITVPAAEAKLTRITKKMLREAERQKEAERQAKVKSLFKEKKASKLAVDLQLNLVNGFMQVGFVVQSNPKAVKALEALGFVLNPQYYFAQIRNYRQLIAQAEKWVDGGFEIGNKVDNDTFQLLAQEFNTGGLRSHRDYARALGNAQFQNYMRMEWKANPNKKLLNLFALITDGGAANKYNQALAKHTTEKTGVETAPNYGIAYMCLPAGGGHPGSRQAVLTKYTAPGTRWALSQPMLSKFVGSIQGVHKVLESLSDAGITVGNIAELNQHAKSVKKVTPRTDFDSAVYQDVAKHKQARAPKKAVQVEEPVQRKQAVPTKTVKRPQAVPTKTTRRPQAVPKTKR